MNDANDIKQIKAFLLRQGHTQEELDRLEQDDMIKLYEKDTRENTLNFLHYMSEDEFVVQAHLMRLILGSLSSKSVKMPKTHLPLLM